MKAKIISLDMRHLKKKNQSGISQKIYGYIDKSNHGKYVYNRKGILSDIHKIILGKGTFVILEKNMNLIDEILKLNVKVNIYNISIKKWF